MNTNKQGKPSGATATAAPKAAPKKAPAKPPQPKIPEKPKWKSIEEAEAAKLLPDEMKSLSRMLILRWFRTKKYGKLKSLQEKIEEDTDGMQTKIKNATVKELKDSNIRLEEVQQFDIANQFATSLVSAAQGTEFEKDLGKLSQVEEDQIKFFYYVGMQGSIRFVETLKRLKNKKELKAYFKKHPGKEAEFDEIVERADYEELAKFLKRNNILPDAPFLSAEKVLFALTVMAEGADNTMNLIHKAPGIGGLIKDIQTYAKTVKDVVHYPFFERAAKKMDVKFTNLLTLNNMTYYELSQRYLILQRYRYLIEKSEKNTTSKLKKKRFKRQLDYIDDVEKVYNHVREARESNAADIRKELRKYLTAEVKKGNLTNNDMEKLLGELNIDGLTVQVFLPAIVYDKGPRQNKSKLYWFNNLLGRGFKMYKAFQFYRGAVTYDTAIARVMGKRALELFGFQAKEQWRTLLNSDLSSTKSLKSLSKTMTKFEKEVVNKYSVRGGADDLDIKAKNYADDMKEHDDILIGYRKLSVKASKVLTEEAQRIIDHGKRLDAVTKGLAGTDKIPLSRIPKETAKALKLKPAPGGTFYLVSDLQKAYTDELIRVKKIRDVVQKRFAALSGAVNERVVGKFNTTWAPILHNDEMKKALQKDMKELKRLNKTTGRAYRTARMLALPVASLSMTLIGAASSKGRWNDIKGDLWDAGIGFVPILGTLNDFKLAYDGYTTSGRKLSNRERIMSGLFCVVGAISDAAWVLGGVGGIMRAGIGSLKSAKGLARVGKISRIGKDVQHAENVTFFQRAGKKIFGLFSGASKATATKRAAESMEASKLTEFIIAKKQLRRIGVDVDSIKHVDDVDDLLKTAGKGSVKYTELTKYRKMLMAAGKSTRYYDELRSTLGISEASSTFFLRTKDGLRKAWNYLRKAALVRGGKELDQVNDMGRVIGRFDDLRKEKKALEKLEAAGKISPSEVKRLTDIRKKINATVEAENKIFQKAEKLARSNLVLSKVAKYMTVGGFAMAGYWLLTGENPVAKKAGDTFTNKAKEAGEAIVVKGGKAVAGGVSWAVKHAATGHWEAPRHFQSMVAGYMRARMEEKQFTKRLKELNRSYDPNKKEKIEMHIAEYWHNGHVRAWAHQNRKKLNMHNIEKYVRRNFRNSRPKLYRARELQEQARKRLPGSMPSMGSTKLGGKSN